MGNTILNYFDQRMARGQTKVRKQECQSPKGKGSTQVGRRPIWGE